jgi:hypothetical protein
MQSLFTLSSPSLEEIIALVIRQNAPAALIFTNGVYVVLSPYTNDKGTAMGVVKCSNMFTKEAQTQAIGILYGNNMADSVKACLTYNDLFGKFLLDPINMNRLFRNKSYIEMYNSIMSKSTMNPEIFSIIGWAKCVMDKSYKPTTGDLTI